MNIIKNYILPVVGVILAVAILCIGALAVIRAVEAHQDEISRAELLDHRIRCDGDCELVSTYKAYCRDATYVYQCNKCKQLFEFYNTDVFRDAMKEATS